MRNSFAVHVQRVAIAHQTTIRQQMGDCGGGGLRGSMVAASCGKNTEKKEAKIRFRLFHEYEMNGAQTLAGADDDNRHAVFNTRMNLNVAQCRVLLWSRTEEYGVVLR